MVTATGAGRGAPSFLRSLVLQHVAENAVRDVRGSSGRSSLVEVARSASSRVRTGTALTVLSDKDSSYIALCGKIFAGFISNRPYTPAKELTKPEGKEEFTQFYIAYNMAKFAGKPTQIRASFDKYYWGTSKSVVTACIPRVDTAVGARTIFTAARFAGVTTFAAAERKLEQAGTSILKIRDAVLAAL